MAVGSAEFAAALHSIDIGSLVGSAVSGAADAAAAAVAVVVDSVATDFVVADADPAGTTAADSAVVDGAVVAAAAACDLASAGDAAAAASPVAAVAASAASGPILIASNRFDQLSDLSMHSGGRIFQQRTLLQRCISSSPRSRSLKNMHTSSDDRHSTLIGRISSSHRVDRLALSQSFQQISPSVHSCLV